MPSDLHTSLALSSTQPPAARPSRPRHAVKPCFPPTPLQQQNRHPHTALAAAVDSAASLEERELQAATGYRLPAAVLEQAALIREATAQEMLGALRWQPVSVPSLGSTVQTAFVGPPSSSGRQGHELPVVMLHGFDSSLLEFRRLWPRLLQAGVDAWAVDLLGWGFSSFDFSPEQDAVLGPVQKREHLYAFWKEKIGRPMVLLGTSLGGAIAIDFATAHPEAVAGLVLADPQGYQDGVAPLPKPLAYLGVKVLQSVWLRQMANRMAYADKERFATEDAMRVGRLHTFLPGWADANVAFIRSRGYSVSSKIPQVEQPCLVLWGRQDEILAPELAARWEKDLPDCRLQWIEACGHCCHLEQPEQATERIAAFLTELEESRGP